MGGGEGAEVHFGGAQDREGNEEDRVQQDREVGIESGAAMR